MTAPAPRHCLWCDPRMVLQAPRVNTADGTTYWVFCPDCGMHGPAGTSEDVAIARWNFICGPAGRPQQSAEPIQLFMCEIPRLTLKPGLPYIFGIDPECEKCAAYISGAASPGPSELVEEIKELAKELRLTGVGSDANRIYCYCARKLEGLINE